MKLFLKNNWFYYLLYFFFLLIAGFVLVNYDKVVIHRHFNQLVGHPMADFVYTWFTYVGDGIVAILLTLIVFILNIRNGLYLFTSYVVSGIISTILKTYVFPEVDRPYPYFTWVMKEKLNLVPGVHNLLHNSMPSGHTTTAFAIFTAFALLTRNKLLQLVFFVIALNAAFSRIYLSQHWLSDVYAGSLLGVICSTLIYYLFYGNSGNFLIKYNRPLFASPS